jgi:hypothetical protein
MSRRWNPWYIFVHQNLIAKHLISSVCSLMFWILGCHGGVIENTIILDVTQCSLLIINPSLGWTSHLYLYVYLLPTVTLVSYPALCVYPEDRGWFPAEYTAVISCRAVIFIPNRILKSSQSHSRPEDRLSFILATSPPLYPKIHFNLRWVAVTPRSTLLSRFPNRSLVCSTNGGEEERV